MKTNQQAWLGCGRLAWAFLGSLAFHGLLGVALCLGPGPKPKLPSSSTFGETGYCGLEQPEEQEPVPSPVVAEGKIEISQAELRNPFDGPPSQVAPVPPGKGHTLSGQWPGSAEASGVTAKFFQVEARGKKIVYVLDCSASMSQHRAWQVAGRELLASLRQLAPTAQFQVIVYNRFASFLLPQRPDWLEAGPETIAAADQALANLHAEGKTEHGPALRQALSLQPDVIFFLTDADDLTTEHLRLVTTCNRQRAVIHTIELNTRNRQCSYMPLQVLARDHGGSYRAVDLNTQP